MDDDAGLLWSFDAATGFISSGLAGRCLAAVPRLISNNVAIAARLTTSDGRVIRPVVAHGASGAAAGSVVSNPMSQLYELPCNASVQLSVGVLSERDARAAAAAAGAAPPAAGDNDALAAAAAAASAALDDRAALVRAQAALSAWWLAYYSKSSIVLPDHPQLQRFVYSMLYLQRSSMRKGKVVPSLWGPFSTTDLPGWSDDITLDYNVSATWHVRRPPHRTCAPTLTPVPPAPAIVPGVLLPAPPIPLISSRQTSGRP